MTRKRPPETSLIVRISTKKPPKWEVFLMDYVRSKRLPHDLTTINNVKTSAQLLEVATNVTSVEHIDTCGRVVSSPNLTNGCSIRIFHQYFVEEETTQRG